jgi:hypothetical protein
LFCSAPVKKGIDMFPYRQITFPSAFFPVQIPEGVIQLIDHGKGKLFPCGSSSRRL